MTTDKRVIRTRKAIQSAFETLVSTTPLTEITVTLITQTADINRKTFYLHYDSIDDLLDSYIVNISEILISILQAHPFEEIYRHPGYLFDSINTLFEAHHIFARTIIFSEDYIQLTNKIINNVTDQLTSIVMDTFHVSKQKANVSTYFLINNTLSLFRLSEQKPNLLPKNKLREYTIELNQNGLSAFV